MKKNIGPKNRLSRIIIGLVIIAIALHIGLSNVISWPIVVVGIVVLLEGLFSYCVVHGAKGTCDMR